MSIRWLWTGQPTRANVAVGRHRGTGVTEGCEAHQTGVAQGFEEGCFARHEWADDQIGHVWPFLGREALPDRTSAP
jgi:hypothetical protein